MNEAPERRIFYIADPMCSWCWGFSPVIGQIAQRFGAIAPIRVVAGGLRPGTTTPMDQAFAQSLRTHWEHVTLATGQSFCFDFFDRDGFVYDTEPACRAVVAVRSTAPDLTLTYLAALHRAFYVENRDITKEPVLTDVAASVGVERAVFEDIIRAPDIVAATRTDFQFAQACGISGFPSVLLQQAGELRVLTIGHQPLSALLEPLEAWVRV